MSSRIFRARCLLPIVGPPIDGGWVACEEGRIVQLGHGRTPGPAEDLGDVALLPGLVNAHTHLELSWLKGRVPPASSMVAWIRQLIAERGASTTGRRQPAEAHEILRATVAEMRSSGTALVGDISNMLGSVPMLDAAGLDAVVFHEILGFNAADPEAAVRDAWTRADAADDTQTSAPRGEGHCRFSVVAHAPYSVSPALFTEIARTQREAPLAVHLAESPEEMEFLKTGRGPFRDLIGELGVWNENWRPPDCGPVEYLRRVGYLNEDCLVVHGVHLAAADRALVREAHAVIVTCPRSNMWVGGGVPPISRFYGDGLRVAIGTDSLASVGSLSMFDEMAEVRRIAPEVDAAQILESATLVGAHALGFPEYGSMQPGQRALFAAVQLAGNSADVEEYLVSGVPSGAVRTIA